MGFNHTTKPKVMAVRICWEFRVQFRLSRYIMRLHRTFDWKVMNFWISWELPLFIFERLDISWAWIIHPTQKLWPLEFSKSFRVQFWAFQYIMCLNRTSELKVMTILISRELLLFNFERLDILCAWIGHPSEKLWPIAFLVSFHCSFFSISMYCGPQLYNQVQSS